MAYINLGITNFEGVDILIILINFIYVFVSAVLVKVLLCHRTSINADYGREQIGIRRGGRGRFTACSLFFLFLCFLGAWNN